jgi:phosphatidylserine/phosphatidylglycerophosphate/cardiolipin synthase-like enzyme
MGFFGSELQLLTDGAIYGRVRDLIAEAKKELIIISPYIDPTGDLVRQIEVASLDRKVDVRLVFRRDRLSEYLGTEWFRRLADAKVVVGTIERLHSKVYANEKFAVVTSMNFYSSSGENSFEAGVLFERDHNLGGQLEGYLAQLQRHVENVGQVSPAVGVRRSTGKERTIPPRARVPAQGHCIRCGEPRAFDTSKPYCREDFEKWAEYENADYPDKFCHGCGSRYPATMNKPLCESCFREFGAA